MRPLLPFAAGLLVGAATVKLLRSEFAGNGLKVAKEKLRRSSPATVMGSDMQSAPTQKRTIVTNAAPADALVDTSVPTKRRARKKPDSATATTKTRRKALEESTS